MLQWLSGVSNFFSSGAQSKTAGAPRSEAEGFTEARSAERRRVGEVVTPSRRWVSGGSPPENFGKLLQNGAFWCILKQKMQISKPKIYVKKTRYFDFFQIYSCIKISKSQIMHNNTMTWILIIVTLCTYISCMFHVYRSQMLIYQTFSFQNPLSSLNFSLIILTIASFKFSYIILIFFKLLY